MAEAEKEYIRAIQSDKAKFEEYYLKSLSVKTEQQKFLESLLNKQTVKAERIADIACGGGSLSFHLHKIFPGAHFSLVDLNEQAIDLARKNLSGMSASFFNESVYDLKSLGGNYFDLVFCWQTLSWLEEPRVALRELIRIAKPGARIYISSLFNLDHEVDVFSKVTDHSKSASKQGLHYNYNTYSKVSVEKWIGDQASSFEIIPFHPEVDFTFDGKGVGTYTRKMDNGERLQFSAGMLMNWGILIITK